MKVGAAEAIDIVVYQNIFEGLTKISMDGAVTPLLAENWAESPDGKADILETKEETGRMLRLFIDQQTHLPLMVQYQDPKPMVMINGGPGGPGRGQGGPGRGGDVLRPARRHRLWCSPGRRTAHQQRQNLHAPQPAAMRTSGAGNGRCDF